MIDADPPTQLIHRRTRRIQLNEMENKKPAPKAASASAANGGPVTIEQAGRLASAAGLTDSEESYRAAKGKTKSRNGTTTTTMLTQTRERLEKNKHTAEADLQLLREWENSGRHHNFSNALSASVKKEHPEWLESNASRAKEQESLSLVPQQGVVRSLQFGPLLPYGHPSSSSFHHNNAQQRQQQNMLAAFMGFTQMRSNEEKARREQDLEAERLRERLRLKGEKERRAQESQLHLEIEKLRLQAEEQRREEERNERRDMLQYLGNNSTNRSGNAAGNNGSNEPSANHAAGSSSGQSGENAYSTPRRGTPTSNMVVMTPVDTSEINQVIQTGIKEGFNKVLERMVCALVAPFALLFPSYTSTQTHHLILSSPLIMQSLSQTASGGDGGLNKKLALADMETIEDVLDLVLPEYEERKNEILKHSDDSHAVQAVLYSEPSEAMVLVGDVVLGKDPSFATDKILAIGEPDQIQAMIAFEGVGEDTVLDVYEAIGSEDSIVFGLTQRFFLEIDYLDEIGSEETKVITVMTEECIYSAALFVCESIIDTFLNPMLPHS